MPSYLRINNQIKVRELRVIDENNANLGILQLQDALKIANGKGLDLIEISPNADPPVARIMSFDKFRYQQAKKEKELKAQQKKQELKQIRIGLNSAPYDLATKAGQADEFLKKGHIVEIFLILRGREKGKKDLARNKICDFLKLIKEERQILKDLKFGGRGFNVQIGKK